MFNASQMVKDFYAHIDENGGDFTALMGHIDPNLRFYVPGEAQPVGLEGFTAFVREIYAAFPDLRHDIGFQLTEGNRVATRMTVSGTHKGTYMGRSPTNRLARFGVHSICAFSDGKLSDYWLEGDLLGLERQLSVA